MIATTTRILMTRCSVFSTEKKLTFKLVGLDMVAKHPRLLLHNKLNQDLDFFFKNLLLQDFCETENFFVNNVYLTILKRSRKIELIGQIHRHYCYIVFSPLSETMVFVRRLYCDQL